MSKTSTKQRIGIWIITIAMIVGTIFSFAGIIIMNINNAEQQKAMQQLQSEYTAKVNALSDKYIDLVKSYQSYPTKFDGSTVTAVSYMDLKEGTGAVIGKDTDYVAYYIGWTPDGVIFDESLDETSNKLNPPIETKSLISGWSEAVAGMKIGGIREITIPADKAYGKQGSGKIKPDTPIRFIVFALPASEAVPMPDYSKAV